MPPTRLQRQQSHPASGSAPARRRRWACRRLQHSSSSSSSSLAPPPHCPPLVLCRLQHSSSRWPCRRLPRSSSSSRLALPPHCPALALCRPHRSSSTCSCSRLDRPGSGASRNSSRTSQSRGSGRCGTLCSRSEAGRRPTLLLICEPPSARLWAHPTPRCAFAALPVQRTSFVRAPPYSLICECRAPGCGRIQPPRCASLYSVPCT